MKQFLILIITIVSSTLGYSQTIFMSTLNPVIQGDATQANYINDIVLNKFEMGVSRFLNMEDLSSSQRANANAELSLVTISFDNKAYVLNGITKAFYENTKFAQVNINMITNTLQGYQEVYAYEFKGVQFSSVSNRAFANNENPRTEATFKAEEMEVTHRIYFSSTSAPWESTMNWNFISNTGSSN